MASEERFWDILKKVFVGADIEGDSGFVNLMRIKSAYFDVVFAELEKTVDQATANSPHFREELFDKLYTFFRRYFSESGSIYFTYTPLKERVYEKVYTNMADIALFWKTHMLYYVKTDQLWRALTVKIEEDGNGEWDILFDVSGARHKDANELRELVFDLGDVDKNGKKITFKVSYSTRGRKTKTDEIAKKLNESGIDLDEESVKRAIHVFSQQNEIDFFINKDARTFLREQFDLYLKTYLLDEASSFGEERLRQIGFLRNIAYSVIEFVAKFEEELKKIWNKPKFAKNGQYVMTLDRLIGLDGGLSFLKSLLNRDGFSSQVEEWKAFGLVEDGFRADSLFSVDVSGERGISEDRRFLCVDTKHFNQETKMDLLRLVENHDECLDGWVVHSENYQALRALQLRFRESIGPIYIDPPYNTGEDGFPYKDRYMHSSWLSMMNDRLQLARDLLKPDSTIMVSIDDRQLYELRLLMDGVFGSSRFIANFVWNTEGHTDNQFQVKVNHEYILTYCRDTESVRLGFVVDPNTRQESNLWKGFAENSITKNGPGNPPSEVLIPCGFPCAVTNLDLPPTDVQATFFDAVKEKGYISRDITKRYQVDYPIRLDPLVVRDGVTIQQCRMFTGWANLNKLRQFIDSGFQPLAEDDGEMRFYMSEGGVIYYRKERSKARHILSVLRTMGTTEKMSSELENMSLDYKYPKPKELVKHLIKIGGEERGHVLDFFAGSGTTGQAVMELNRETAGPRTRFLLIEMANCVHEVIIPRLKKHAFSNDWKDGKPQNNSGQSLFFKYYDLEQYEEVLRKAVYRESHPLHESADSADLVHSYLFLDDRKLLNAVDLSGGTPRIDLGRVCPDVDLAETLANLLGKAIARIRADSVEFDDGSSVSFDNLSFAQVRELIWW